MTEDEAEEAMGLKRKSEELFSAVLHTSVEVDANSVDVGPVSGDAMRIMGVKL